MTVVGRSLFPSSLMRICKEIRSLYMSPFQIWLVSVCEDFREDFQEAIESGPKLFIALLNAAMLKAEGSVAVASFANFTAAAADPF